MREKEDPVCMREKIENCVCVRVGVREYRVCICLRARTKKREQLCVGERDHT